jgi:orotate phosphoribosyltransferase
MPPSRNPGASARRTEAPREAARVDAQIRERIHLEILRRTGAYRTDDHFLLPSGHHAPEFIDKALVTTEPAFTEGLGGVIAKHFAEWPADVVLSTGPGASILAHCVARALPSRPVLVYATKEAQGASRRVRLPDEFRRFVGSRAAATMGTPPGPSRSGASIGAEASGASAAKAAGSPAGTGGAAAPGAPGAKVLIVEDLITTGETIKLLIQMVTEAGGAVVGIGCLWQRNTKVNLPRETFSLVTRDFPTYQPEACPLCRAGKPLNTEFARAEPPTEDPIELDRPGRASRPGR